MEGRTVYFGSPGGALQHYSSLSFMASTAAVFANHPDVGRAKFVSSYSSFPNTEVSASLMGIMNNYPKSSVFTRFSIIQLSGDSHLWTPPNFASPGLQCPRDESPPDFFMRCVATDAGEDADRQQAKQNVETLLKALPPLATPDMPKKFDPKAEDRPWHGSHGMAWWKSR